MYKLVPRLPAWSMSIGLWSRFSIPHIQYMYSAEVLAKKHLGVCQPLMDS